MLGASDYQGNPNGRQGRPFEPYNVRGYTVLEVLPMLKGRPWDDFALGVVHSLRPSHLRVVQGGIQLDAQTWRVTVWLNKDGQTIKRIDQEVEVGLPDGYENGGDITQELNNHDRNP